MVNRNLQDQIFQQQEGDCLQPRKAKLVRRLVRHKVIDYRDKVSGYQLSDNPEVKVVTGLNLHHLVAFQNNDILTQRNNHGI